MKYFQELVEELNLSNDYLPLWKVIDRMNQSHVDSLVDYIQEHTSMNRNVCYYAQEVCLLYAYWWQKISQGRRGGHNYMDIISDMNLKNVKEEQLKDAVLYELQTAQKLNIPIYKSNTTRWLDSVLAQGGIPLQWMTTQTNTDYILRFLKALLHHYENIIIPDWYNTSIAEEMAKQYNMPAYAQNQAYCGYCLSIVQSIIMKESIVSGSSIVQNIINQVAQEHNNYEYRLFGITWYIKANQRGDYSICYTLKVPKSIDISEESETSSRRYYLNGKFVAEYLRQGDKFYLQQGTNIPTFEIIQDETEALFLEQMEDNGVLEGVPMYNSIMPVIEEPVSLRYDSADYWNLNTNNGGERIGIICPAGWKPVSDLPYKNVRLQNEDYLWIEVDWSNSTHEHIELRKGEESYFVYKNNIDYELYLNFPQFDWIEKASRLIVDSSANLSHCIYVRDSEGNPISASKWKLYIKSAEDFVPYTKTTRLRSGLNTMRICMPDNRSKYIRFFYVQSVNYRRTSGNSFSFDCNDIDLHLIPNQDVIQVDSTYTCNNQVLSVGFQLSSNGSDMILHVSSPKPDSSFWSIENGKKMLSNSNISINDLHKYKVYRNGRDKLHISYKSNYDETIVTNSTIELGSDQFTTLSFISGILERMLVLYPLTRARRIELTISNSTITIVTDPYNLFTLKDDEGLKIQVSYNNEIQKDIPLAAINLDEILDENFTIIDLPAANDEGYCLVPESISSTPFIVFSKDPSRRFPTELIDVNEEELPLEEHIRRRNSRKAESIAKINEVLSGDNYKNWGHVWRQMEVAIKYRLPYVTFNSLIVIKNNPFFLTHFITNLHPVAQACNISTDDIVLELERMEYELGFAFHCIPTECWQPTIDNIKIEYETVMLPTLRSLNMNMDVYEYINTKCIYYEQLLKRQFGENNINILLFKQINNFSPSFNITLNNETYYAALISGTYIPGGRNLDKKGYRQPKGLRLSPYIKLKDCITIENIMRYFSIVIPQEAAQNTNALDLQFWEYNEISNFTQRLINYIRRYAPKVYNEIFIACIN